MNILNKYLCFKYLHLWLIFTFKSVIGFFGLSFQIRLIILRVRICFVQPYKIHSSISYISDRILIGILVRISITNCMLCSLQIKRKWHYIKFSPKNYHVLWNCGSQSTNILKLLSKNIKSVFFVSQTVYRNMSYICPEQATHEPNTTES